MVSEQSKQPSKQVTEARAATQRTKLNAQAAERRRSAEHTSKTTQRFIDHVAMRVSLWDIPSQQKTHKLSCSLTFSLDCIPLMLQLLD